MSAGGRKCVRNQRKIGIPGGLEYTYMYMYVVSLTLSWSTSRKEWDSLCHQGSGPVRLDSFQVSGS